MLHNTGEYQLKNVNILKLNLESNIEIYIFASISYLCNFYALTYDHGEYA